MAQLVDRIIHPDLSSFLLRMKDTIRREITSVSPSAPYALLHYPNSRNVGDSAIWLGALEVLRELTGSDPVYVCDIASFDPRELRYLTGNGPVFINGGGSFGSIWPDHQAFRLRLFRQLPNNPIVQLPQTIFFDSPVLMEDTRRAISDHGNVTLLCRDLRSLETARTEFSCRCSLCPDLAFLLSFSPERAATAKILFLLRSDQERNRRIDIPHSVKTVDWYKSLRVIALTRGGKIYDNVLRVFAPRSQKVRLHAFRSFAAWKVDVACSILNSSSVVITDRLHGHILATMLGIPHVILDNSYGKISSFYDSWTNDLSLIRWADTLDQASALALILRR